MSFGHFGPLAIACAILVVGCTPGRQSEAGGSSVGPASQPKRMVVVSREEPVVLNDKAAVSGNGDVVEELVSAGLVRFEPLGDAQPLMAEAVPTLENGLVKLAPDGRMETSWRLKEGLKWHDGMPITTEDILFGLRVAQDKDLPSFSNVAFASIEQVRADDSRTIVVVWKEPYIQYDRMFSWQAALPLPRHLLENSYLEDKANFTNLRYWMSDEFVHAGPFRVRQFVPAERLLLSANPDYILGRPKLDELEVRFVPDGNAFIANVVGGEAQFTMGSSTTVGQAKAAADRWPDGRLEVSAFQSSRGIVPQFMNPDPPVQLDLRFRRALAHGFDKVAFNDVINAGVLPPPANSMLSIGSPEFAQIKDSIVEYPYDPRRSAELLEEIGYRRVGTYYQDANGRELSIEFLDTRGGAEEQLILSALDGWNQIGIHGVPDIRAGAVDREVRATRPGLTLNSGSFNLVEPRRLFQWFHGSQSPTPENRFQGNNRSRYANAELDALIDRFFVTVPKQERLELMKQIIHHQSDNATVTTAYHIVYPALINNRVSGVTARTGFAQAWNSHLWDIQ
jgi:peptide/nickel transport system substrate-binding protein